MKKRRGQAALRRTAAVLLALLALLGAAACAGAAERTAASPGAFLLRTQMALGSAEDTSLPSAAVALVLHGSALLQKNASAPAPETRQSDPADEETHEGTVLSSAEEGDSAAEETPSDNGVAAKTIHPVSRAGYLVWKDVLITNTSGYSPDLAALMQSPPDAKLTDEMPQVLILHTHGTEGYTTPAEDGFPATDGRSEDTERNVVRVGDEIALALEERGISVLHDRTMYDKSGYTDAYARAEQSIAAYLQKYPSIHFVLDVHRDAIEDRSGKVYKVISAVDGKNAAQISLVVGSDGGGLPHEHWQENLKLALLVQQHLTEQYPTLMRPMYLRASRYNEHATTGSLLVEVGAAGNSLDEALYAAHLFADGFADVIQTSA